MWTITNAIRSSAKASRTSHRGCKDIDDSPTVMDVSNESYANGIINFRQYINEYTELQDDLEVGIDLFSGHKLFRSTKKQFLKRQHLVTNIFTKSVKNASFKKAVRRTGTKI